MRKKVVLLVDDEKEFCNLIKLRLQATGTISVITAYSGRAGLRKAKTKKPDLILLDIKMPDINGIEVLKLLKKDEVTNFIPVILLTALDDDELKKEAVKLYNEDYMVKPVKLLELQKKIEKILKMDKKEEGDMEKIKIEKASKEKLEKMGVFSWPIWEKEVSKFPWYYDQTEKCYIIEGEVTIEDENGKKVTFGAGDFVEFPKGLKCTWDIKKPVRKHYSFE